MNSKFLSVPAAVLALALGGTAPASADVPITINAGGAYWYFDGDRRMDDTGTPWVSLEYGFTERLAAEIFYAEDETELNRGSEDVDVATWSLNMLYYPGGYAGGPNQLSPYVVLGGGEIDYDGDNWDTVETTVNLGAGVRWMWTKRLGGRLETRLLHSVDENRQDYLFSAGVNFYFGDVEPEVVAAAAPVDSDGDGVADDSDKCPGTPAGTRVDSFGCPLPVARIASIKMKVNFPFDSAVVQEQYFDDVDELAKFLQRFQDVHVAVEGHTDSVGPDDYNQLLSERRAKAVIDLLVNQHGIAASRLEAKGFGESQPVASNDTREGRAENRRVMATLEVEYEE